MNRLISLHTSVFGAIESQAPLILPTLARIVFAGVLFVYFWNSAMTKLGDGISGLWTLSFGAYAQIFPKTFEALGYDPSALPLSYKLVALAGTWAEIILPILIVIGLLTRLASIGMIGFILVQSWVDVTGHNLNKAGIGAWFDPLSSGLLLDQRAFWVFVLLYLVFRGAGPISVDALLGRQSKAALVSAP
jgi:putative oxidoreductase